MSAICKNLHYTHFFGQIPFVIVHVYIYSDPPPANVIEDVVIAVESKTINMRFDSKTHSSGLKKVPRLQGNVNCIAGQLVYTIMHVRTL